VCVLSVSQTAFSGPLPRCEDAWSTIRILRWGLIAGWLSFSFLRWVFFYMFVSDETCTRSIQASGPWLSLLRAFSSRYLIGAVFVLLPPFGSQFQTLPDNPRSHEHSLAPALVFFFFFSFYLPSFVPVCEILRGWSSLATCECAPLSLFDTSSSRGISCAPYTWYSTHRVNNTPLESPRPSRFLRSAKLANVRI
jgi:hypothetical protein